MQKQSASLVPYLKITKTLPEAEIPFKDNPSNVGWDITIVSRTDNRTEDVFNDINRFDTGLRIEQPEGYYIEFMVHPALVEAGYSIAGGSNIFINPDNNNSNIIVSLYKFRDVEDLQLPFRALVMFVRPIQNAYFHIPGAKPIPETKISKYDDDYAVLSSSSRRTHGGTKKISHMY